MRRPIVLALGVVALVVATLSRFLLCRRASLLGKPIRIIVPFAAGGAVDELAKQAHIPPQD